MNSRKIYTKKAQWHANMTELNHLGAALLTSPDKLVPHMNQLFSARNYYADNPLTSILSGLSREKVITTTEWEYDVRASTMRPLVVMEDLDPTNDQRGKYRQPFNIVFDENWGLPGDVMTPGNVQYQARIVEKRKTMKGEGYTYTLRQTRDEKTAFIPGKYFKKGQTWNKLYSTYEEGTEQAGSTLLTTPMTLRNKISKIRKTYRITDYALQEVLRIAVPDSKGNYHQSWIRYAEVEYWLQWYRERERLIWYSQFSETVTGANGRPVRMGAGIKQQLDEDAWNEGYNILTPKLIEDFVLGIMYSRKKPGKSRAGLKGFSGDYGMINFHKAMLMLDERSGLIRDMQVVTKNISSPLHSNAKQTGLQYVKYLMANGATLEMIHNPIQDDRDIHTEIDPITGYPKESQRIMLLDMDMRGKESNIMLVKKKGSYSFTYVEGTISPYGAKKGGTSAHGGDYYDMIVGESLGAQIIDPTSCGQLYLERND